MDGPLNPERNVIDIGPPDNRHRAIHFRHSFRVTDPAQYTNLILRVLGDDGSVVYLNGTEVARFNLTNAPGVPVNYADLARLDASDGTAYHAANVSPSLLVPAQWGLNVLAVEVHQESVVSPDLSFDAMLSGESVCPDLKIQPGANSNEFVLTWPACPCTLLQVRRHPALRLHDGLVGHPLGEFPLLVGVHAADGFWSQPDL